MSLVIDAVLGYELLYKNTNISHRRENVLLVQDNCSDG